MNPQTIIPQQAPPGINIARADFNQNKFDVLIWEKGGEVIHYKSLICACKSKNSNYLSDCMNCGGTGYVFYNPVQTRMVLHSINLQTKFQAWSEINIGTSSVTAMSENKIAHMDKIVALDGDSIFTQNLFLKTFVQSPHNIYYWNTIYDIKEIEYLGLWVNSTHKFKQLFYGVDFIYTENKITFLTASDYIDFLKEEQDISITIRYIHAPEFHIIDLPRDTIQTILKNDTQATSLPVHGIARRSHFVLNRENSNHDRLLDNSIDFVFENLNPPIEEC